MTGGARQLDRHGAEHRALEKPERVATDLLWVTLSNDRVERPLLFSVLELLLYNHV